MDPAALSHHALHLAARRSFADAADAARWLYRYGTVPCTDVIVRDFGAGDEPMAVLGLASTGSARRRLAESYDGATYPGWLSFSHHAAGDRPHAGFKLYVSPRPEALAAAFPLLAGLFARHEVRAFKVGRGLDGLLRPDKIVAYFDDEAHMQAVAAAISAALRGCPAQGVPFTARFAGRDDDGLVSHGFDPPADGEPQSWRGWVTRRLAEHLLAARKATGADAVTGALATASAAGIDTDGWTANAALFASAPP